MMPWMLESLESKLLRYFIIRFATDQQLLMTEAPLNGQSWTQFNVSYINRFTLNSFLQEPALCYLPWSLYVQLSQHASF